MEPPRKRVFGGRAAGASGIGRRRTAHAAAATIVIRRDERIFFPASAGSRKGADPVGPRSSVVVPRAAARPHHEAGQEHEADRDARELVDHRLDEGEGSGQLGLAPRLEEGHGGRQEPGIFLHFIHFYTIL